jgi:CheY-like chemotaxis protein
MNQWNILVVEDDADGQEVVGRVLRHFKIASQIVGTAEDALEVLPHNNYTGVVIDLHLPGMDGWTLLGTIRNDPRLAHVPCVAITAYHSADVAVKAIEAGFAAYFPKPLDATTFVRELQRVLN